MRFQVPQFIGVEDKIFGPFTAKQFVYVAGGGALCFLIYKYLPFLIALIFLIPVVAITIALAFIKVNGKPFVFILEAAFKYFFGSKLYLWKKEEKNVTGSAENYSSSLDSSYFAPKIGNSKLKDMNWNLDVNRNQNNSNK